MKRIVSGLIIVLLLVTSVFFMYSCGTLSSGGADDEISEDSVQGTTKNEITFDDVYAKAKELGFDGTIENLLALIRGDGSNENDESADAEHSEDVCVTNIETDSLGHLLVRLSSGYAIDCCQAVSGQAVGAKEDAVGSAEINDEGHLIVTAIDGTATDFGKVDGDYSDSLDKVNVFFESNGGSSVSAQSVHKGEKLLVPNEPTRAGYRFDGWYLGDERWTFCENAAEYDMVLTARWREAYMVTFVVLDSYEYENADNLSDVLEFVEFVSSQCLAQGEYADAPVLTDTEDRTYSEWKTLIDDGSGNAYLGSWNLIAQIQASMNLEDVVVMSISNTVVTVKFDINGELEIAPVRVSRGQCISEPEIANEDYKVRGWYTDQGDEWNFDDPVIENMTLTANLRDPDAKYDWDTTELVFQMNKHSQNNELSSGCERYYAGEGNKNETIDTLIAARNEASLTKANVTVKYSYLDDHKAEYGWGKNIDTIVKQSLAGGSSAPDMYCNFAYDMTCAAIKGAFANLYSTKYDSNGNGKGENYFRFTDDDYNPTITNFFDSTAGEGYFVGYMDSLSLSKGKAYCLASDYCTDLVRSFLVVPVNIQLLESVKTDFKDNVKDTTGDGKYGIEDFYNMVWNDENWTYDMVADISYMIFENTDIYNDTVGATSHLGDKLGFAVGASSGITSSGLLYSTDVSIIDRETLTYPAENPGLMTVATKLALLFSNNKNNGVAVVNTADAKALGYSGDLEGIRQEFAKGNILFGGIVAVGSLEDSVYQSMKANGGFGIAPIPLYQKSNENNAYSTQVHNLARIVGISVTTDAFEMCTAFLNEQSMNSSNILNEYYNVNFAKVVGGDAGEWNVKMLVYIRNHVNDCFDATMESVIKDYDNSGRNVAWHDYLASVNYTAIDLSTIYASSVPNKTASLNRIKEAWSRLTD